MERSERYLCCSCEIGGFRGNLLMLIHLCAKRFHHGALARTDFRCFGNCRSWLSASLCRGLCRFRLRLSRSAVFSVGVVSGESGIVENRDHLKELGLAWILLHDGDRTVFERDDPEWMAPVLIRSSFSASERHVGHR